jgi:hypothetical protein
MRHGIQSCEGSRGGSKQVEGRVGLSFLSGSLVVVFWVVVGFLGAYSEGCVCVGCVHSEQDHSFLPSFFSPRHPPILILILIFIFIIKPRSQSFPFAQSDQTNPPFFLWGKSFLVLLPRLLSLYYCRLSFFSFFRGPKLQFHHPTSSSSSSRPISAFLSL